MEEELRKDAFTSTSWAFYEISYQVEIRTIPFKKDRSSKGNMIEDGFVLQSSLQIIMLIYSAC